MSAVYDETKQVKTLLLFATWCLKLAFNGNKNVQEEIKLTSRKSLWGKGLSNLSLAAGRMIGDMRRAQATGVHAYLDRVQQNTKVQLS